MPAEFSGIVREAERDESVNLDPDCRRDKRVGTFHDVRISVVIPCLNAATTLPRCLTSLRMQSVAGDLDIIVVDNGSTDGSVSVAKDLGAHVVVSNTPGSAAARNHGIEQSAADFILSLDADCVPADDEWAEKHIEALRSADDMVIGTAGRTYPAPGGDPWSQRVDVTPHPAWSEHGEPLYAVAGNACYRRELLLSVGAFPPTAADDAALGMIARRMGLRFMWVPEAAVLHENPGDWLGYFRQMTKVGYYAAELSGRPASRRSFYAGQGRRLASALRPMVRANPLESCAIVLKTIGQIRGSRRAWGDRDCERTPGARWSEAFQATQQEGCNIR